MSEKIIPNYYCEEGCGDKECAALGRCQAKAPAPDSSTEADSKCSLKFQDGICPDCESQDLCIQDNGCHNSGKIFSQADRLTCEKADSTSETPRVDAEDRTDHSYESEHGVVCSEFARQLERELAQAIKERDEAKNFCARWMAEALRGRKSVQRQLNTRLRKQLATATEALEEIAQLRYVGGASNKDATRMADSALAAIKENRGS